MAKAVSIQWAEARRLMAANQQGPTSLEEYETALFAAKFAMTNEELDKAIDTAARHSGTSYGHDKCRQINNLPECEGCTAEKDVAYIEQMKRL